MKRFSEQFYKESQKVKMTPEERGVLRERVLSFMEFHALPVEEVIAETVSWTSYLQYWKYAGAVTMVLLMVPPFLAQNAMPGDLLYPLKTEVNEEVRGYLAFGNYEKIEWETTRIERRLAEARLLAESGELSVEEEANVVAAVEKYTANAQASIDALRESDAEEASLAQIAFASALEVQADALQNERVEAATRGEEPQHLQLSATVAAKSSAAAEAVAEANILSTERLFARLEVEGTIARELFESIKASASEEESRKIDDRIEAIKRKIEKAQKLENGEETTVTIVVNGENIDMSDAREVLKIALSDLRKLISFMTNIDVRSSVSVDVVVPAEIEVPVIEEETKDEQSTSTEVLPDDVVTATTSSSTNATTTE